jgi:hypothetical protein
VGGLVVVVVVGPVVVIVAVPAGPDCGTVIVPTVSSVVVSGVPGWPVVVVVTLAFGFVPGVAATLVLFVVSGVAALARVSVVAVAPASPSGVASLVDDEGDAAFWSAFGAGDPHPAIKAAVASRATASFFTAGSPSLQGDAFRCLSTDTPLIWTGKFCHLRSAEPGLVDPPRPRVQVSRPQPPCPYV